MRQCAADKAGENVAGSPIGMSVGHWQFGTLPGEQGARYLAEMQRLTVDLHEQLEDVMAHPTHEHP